MSTCDNNQTQCVNTASGSMTGVGQSCQTQVQQAFGIGAGLRINGNNIEVDYCGLLACVAARTPGAGASILFCDGQGLGKVSVADLLASVTPVADTPPNYTLEVKGTAMHLNKNGLSVSYVPIPCTCTCTTPSESNYTLTATASSMILAKNGITVSTAPVPCTCNTGGGVGGGTANTPPVANNTTATTVKNIPVTIANLLSNATDADGDTLTLTSVGTPTSGTAVLNGTSVVYTPAANFVGTATFTYTVSDGKGGLSTANVVVTVEAGGSSGGGGGGGGGGGNLI